VTSTWVPAHLAPLDGSEDALCALEEAWGSSPVSGGRCATRTVTRSRRSRVRL